MTMRERARVALERAKVATGRPWYADAAVAGNGSVVMSTDTGFRVAHLPETNNVHNHAADAEFIAAARTDVEDFAAHILRITSPEMRERIAQVLMENSAMTEGSAAKHARDVMGLLTEEPAP